MPRPTPRIANRVPIAEKIRAICSPLVGIAD
jgi:hypothetical protein